MEIRQITEGLLLHKHFLQKYNSGSLTDMSSMIFLYVLALKRAGKEVGSQKKRKEKSFDMATSWRNK